MQLGWLGDFAYVLIVCSYLVKDMLWLRSLAILASLSMITFNYLVPETPLWVMVRWNAVMLLINVAQIVILVHERRGAQMNEEEKELYTTLFRNMSPVEFMKLIRLGDWDRVPRGRVVLREGDKVDHLTLVYNGAMNITREGQEVATLKDGAFIGEMSFITEKPASATVTATTNSRIIQWPKDALNRLLLRNPAMRISMQAALGSDMATKLGS
ncbi:MAG: cyclic nucleotide-binding domain-containing protein [Candidatus Omnitrophota bacterium]|nr:cyclic nucleotide-binding domain-containing protein [Candidatus Omnitrophota bacterium]